MLIQIHANLLKNHFLSNIVHTKYEIIHLQYRTFHNFYNAHHNFEINKFTLV